MASASVDFYFAYEIMEQMAALYSVAFWSHGEDAAAMLDSVVADLGIIHKLAEKTLNGAKRGEAAGSSRWIELAERLRRLQTRLNHWTGRRRLLRVLAACESCWQVALADMVKAGGPETRELGELAGASRRRALMLVSEAMAVHSLHLHRNERYAVPVPL